MEPRFHSGDLAVVRSRGSYHVGEIVAYQNKMLHTIVLHRIIGRAGSRYIFKGDNNDFVDFEHPAASQLIGALWIHVPGLGARLQAIRSPALVGILIAIGVLLLSGAAFTRQRRLKRRDLRAGEGVTQPPMRFPQQTGASPVLVVLAIGTVALFPFVVLALLAFTRAPSQRSSYKIPYKQSGTLSYAADAMPGPVYANNRAVTGEPLFTRVLSTVDLHFATVSTPPPSTRSRASLAVRDDRLDQRLADDALARRADLLPRRSCAGHRHARSDLAAGAGATRRTHDRSARLLHAHDRPARERERRRRRRADPRDVRARNQVQLLGNRDPGSQLVGPLARTRR